MLGSFILERFGLQSNGAVEASPEGDARAAFEHYTAAQELKGRGLYAEAVEELKEALRKNSDFAEAHNEFGDVYRSLGNMPKAIKAYQAAIRIQPEYVIAHDGLGMAYDGSGNFLEAIKIYMRALRLAPNSVDTRTNLGMTYYNIGSYAEATKAFNHALQIDPASVQARYGLGLVYIDLRRKDLALNEVEALENSGRKDVAASLLERVERQCE